MCAFNTELVQNLGHLTYYCSFGREEIILKKETLVRVGGGSIDLQSVVVNSLALGRKMLAVSVLPIKVQQWPPLWYWDAFQWCGNYHFFLGFFLCCDVIGGFSTKLKQVLVSLFCVLQ